MTQDAEHRILQRLEAYKLAGQPRVSGFYHLEDQAILRRLEATGRVETWPGTGRDTGLLLARLKRPPGQHAVGSEGGAA